VVVRAPTRTWPVAVAVALGIAGCCPPLEPEEPRAPAPAPSPVKQVATTTSTTIRTPQAVRSHFEARPPAKVEPKRQSIQEPPVVPPAGPKLEPELPKRETLTQPEPPRAAPTETLPDEVVMKLLESGRPAFVRCFKLAVRNDPTTISFKVRLHVELDGEGAVTKSNADTTDSALAGCLVRALGWVRFPASGRPVAVELPLFYRAE
jgi:hypothetical protein